jgi:acyl dehydratase
MITVPSVDNVIELVGQELGVSSWRSVDQPLITAFAELTGDRQWIHVDEERARRETPYGTTIAHGLLILSMLPSMRAEVNLIPEDVDRVLNYGYDRIRFLAPVKAGARVRTHAVLTEVRPKANTVLVTTRNTVEIEGEKRHALVADALTLLVRGS